MEFNATTSLTLIHSQPPLLQRLAGGKTSSARRRLNFGMTETTREANDRFVAALMNQMAESYRSKWEFDFDAGQPLPSSSESRFRYSLLDASSTPLPYHTNVHSPSPSSDEENISDAENAPLPAPINLNCLDESAASSVDLSSESFEFESPKKVLRKPNGSAYATPKKLRQSQLNGEFIGVHSLMFFSRLHASQASIVDCQEGAQVPIQLASSSLGSTLPLFNGHLIRVIGIFLVIQRFCISFLFDIY